MANEKIGSGGFGSAGEGTGSSKSDKKGQATPRDVTTGKTGNNDRTRMDNATTRRIEDDADFRYGVFHTESGNYEQAEECFLRALRYNPDEPQLLFRLGYNSWCMEKHEEAEKYFRQVLEITPDHSTTLGNMAFMLMQLGRLEEAEEYYKKAIASNNSWSYLHNQYALMLRDSGRIDEAEVQFKRALEITKDYSGCMIDYGVFIMDHRKLEDAIPLFRRVIELGREFVGLAYYNLACLASRQGNKGEALANLRLALEKKLKGEQDFRHMASEDVDFENLRSDPDFQEIIKPVAEDNK